MCILQTYNNNNRVHFWQQKSICNEIELFLTTDCTLNIKSLHYISKTVSKTCFIYSIMNIF